MYQETKGTNEKIIDFAIRLYELNKHDQSCPQCVAEIKEIAETVNKFVKTNPRDKTPQLEGIDTALRIFEMYKARCTGLSNEFNVAYLVKTAKELVEFIERP
ncbi:MAG: hypothetical protein LBI67_05530 [Treponema sp.]|nr:hypothetical protein [Treponema sp.]